MAEKLETGVDLAHDALDLAVMHIRRVADIVSTAVGDLAQEFGDIAWDYRNIANPEQPTPRD
jgi:hypothetical protein